MISELIKRFRYRFQLWRRERRESSFWRPGPTLAKIGEQSKWGDPKYQALLAEATWKFVLRGFGLYFGGVMLFTAIARLIVRLVPTAQFTTLVILSVLVGLWTLFVVSGA